ncbi:MAG: putative sortase [Microgenomates group bacterium Gr01-1014_80]|nr:MAG: putative sortase [Microgenomates group bacterium Gr01-1014_80]
MFFAGLIGLAAFFTPLIQAELDYRSRVIKGIKRVVQAESTPTPIGFGSISAGFKPEEMIIPVSTEFGIVIEKINANAKVVGDVNPASEPEYTNALKMGVAHAKGTSYPGQVGNIYLFSHSTDAPWNIIRYNAVFYLLRELQPGDKVLLFYQGRRFDYEVFDKRVAEANETSFLTNKYDKSILTLQTCDPPGTLWKRLIVRAKLVGT